MAADGTAYAAAVSSPERQGSSPTAAPAAGLAIGSETFCEVDPRMLQRHKNEWQNVADFWYFAEAQHDRTIGHLKQQLLQSLLQGDIVVSSAAARVLALARRSFNQRQQCLLQNFTSGFHLQACLPVCSCIREAPRVELRLKGALLPDGQPLRLLESEDCVDICLTIPTLPAAPAENSCFLSACAEACADTCSSPGPPLHVVDGALHDKLGNSFQVLHTPHTLINKAGFVSQKGSLVGSGAFPAWGRCATYCGSEHRERETLGCPGRPRGKKDVASSQHNHTDKRRRVDESHAGPLKSMPTHVIRKVCNAGAQLPAPAATSKTVLAQRRVVEKRAKMKAGNHLRLRRKIITCNRVPVSLRATTPSSKSRSSPCSSSNTSSSRCTQINDGSRSSSKVGGKKSRDSTQHKRPKAARPSDGVSLKEVIGFEQPRQDHALTKLRASSTGAPKKAAAAFGAQKKREKQAPNAAAACASRDSASNKRSISNVATVSATAPVVDDCRDTCKSVRKGVFPKQNPRRVPPEAAAAGSRGGAVSVEESSSEDESGSIENDLRKGGRGIAQGKKREIDQPDTVGATETPETALTEQKQQRPQPQRTAGGTCTIESYRGSTSSEKSRSDTTSSDDTSNSSSSEDSSCSSSNEEEEDPFIRARGAFRRLRRKTRGRMPAAVARAAAASEGRPAATVALQHGEKVDSTREGRAEKSALLRSSRSLLQSPSETTVNRGSSDTSTSDKSGARGEPNPSVFGGVGDASSAGEMDKGTSAQKEAASTRKQPSFRQHSEEQRQRQHQRQSQREEARQQLGRGQEQKREAGPGWQLLHFKPWAEPSLAAVQPGQWLRIRLLQVVGGMPTLTEWKTVFVEATDISTERVRVWELYQRRRAEKPENNSRKSSSYSCKYNATNRSTAERCAVETEERENKKENDVVRVPFRKVNEKQSGGPGRWFDWSAIACVLSPDATAEQGRAEAAPSLEIVVTSAAETAAGSAQVTTPAGEGREEVGCMVEMSTNVRGDDVVTNAEKAAGATTEGWCSAEEKMECSASPLRYLPRRLLSLRQDTLTGGVAALGAGILTEVEPGFTQRRAKKMEEAMRSTERIEQHPNSPASSCSSKTLFSSCSSTLLSSKKTTTMNICVENAQERTSKNDASPGSKPLAKQPTTTPCVVLTNDESPLCGTSVGFALTAPPPAERCSGAGYGLLLTENEARSAATAARSGQAYCKGVALGCSAAGDAAKRTKTVAEDGAATISVADREKEQWEALIKKGLEIWFSEDGEALLASHPAAPAAAFQLPLPRELLEECSRRCEAASRYQEKNSKVDGERGGSDSALSCNGGEVDAENSVTPFARVTASRADAPKVSAAPSEKQSSQQQQPAEECVTEGVGIKGKGTEREAVCADAGKEKCSGSGTTKRIVMAKNWKGFECVKACALRIVGEQLEHRRRALRRQVDYYFSPVNWQRDIYLRSRAVPVSSCRFLSVNSNSYPLSSAKNDFLSCISEANGDFLHPIVASSSSTAAAANNSAGADCESTATSFDSICVSEQRAASEKEKAGDVGLAVPLNEIMLFPRLQTLSTDRDFVFWCLNSGGGLKHVRLEREGDNYWLVRKNTAKTTP